VSEQQPRNYGCVIFRCKPCRRRHGDAPTLAVLERAADQRWQIRVMERRHTLAAMRRLDALGMGREELTRAAARHETAVNASVQLTDADRVRVMEIVYDSIADLRPNVRLGLQPLELHGRGKGVELACGRCGHRPGKKLRDLYALAEDAIDKGRRDEYL